MKLVISTPSDILAHTSELIDLIKEYRIVLFEGEMGVGKTTLIKELAQSVSENEEISSPTYSIVNEYESKIGIIYHFDLYRLNDLGEALDVGIEEYLSSGYICLIEWPSVISELLPIKHLKINISLQLDFSRLLEVDKYG